MKNNQSILFSVAYILVALCSVVVQQVQSFAPSALTTTVTISSSSSSSSTQKKELHKLSATQDELLEAEINMPPSNSGLQAQIKLKPILDGPSELIEVRYQLPFGLDVQPQNGMAVCTKDGPGGEQVGDVLRLSSQWTMGLPRGNGLVSTAASFSGAIGWQCSLFDVMKAGQWEEVVEALTSNTPQRTDEVLLVFERQVQQQE